jgi:hypothetical protein
MAAEDSTTTSLASSFTDLMTSLAVIFILLLVAAVSNELLEARKTQASVDEMKRELSVRTRSVEDRRKDLIARLEATLVPQLPGLQIEEDPNDPFGVLVIPPKTLERFVKNHFETPAAGRRIS